MVVDGDRQLLLGGLLPDYVLVQIFLQFERPRQLSRRSIALIVPVILNDRITNCDAFIANVRPRIITRRGDELANYVLALMAEGTTKGIV